MSRFFSRFMMLAGALLVFAGCDEAKQDAPANDTLVIGYENFAPYLYAGSGGKPTGFDFDLANEVARRNGWKTEFRVIPWQDKEELLDAGEIDCLWGGMKLTAQRKDSFLCCAPYLLSAEVVVATRASCIQSPADLAGKTLAVQRTTPDFREFTDGSQKHLGSKLKKMVMVDDFSDICELLETGKVDAVATDYLVASHLWRNNPEIVILPKSIIDTWNVIGFNGRNTLPNRFENGVYGISA